MTDRNYLRKIVNRENANLDIVAIHGLNPINKAFHAEATWTANNGKMWLQDFLPTRLPDARIFLFGYNSNVAIETSTAGVNEQAENMLNRLSFERKNVPSQRPIIFIAHSLGGIIVKRALVEAKLDDKYQSVREATFGLIFFATPHRGSDHAKLGDIAAKVARTILRSPVNTYMDSLKKNSLFSKNLQGEFRHQYEDYSILSFYETLPVERLGIVVDKESATLGLSGHRETAIAVEADHQTICKFNEAECPAYRQVEDNIADLAERAVCISRKRLLQKTLQIPATQMVVELHKRTFFVPYTENADFVGREKILQRLIEILSPQHGRQRRAALYGLGGVGKTQIAIKYAYWCHENQPNTSVFWIHASNFERFHQSFIELAEGSNIPGADSPKADVFEIVRSWLSQKESGDWLMVIDNADDFGMFFDPLEEHARRSLAGKLVDYIPDCPHGAILLTTRDKKVGIQMLKSIRCLIQTPRMGISESTDFVQKILAGEEYKNEEEIKLLTSTLEHLPLALAQAAAFILENSISVQIYLQRYGDSKANAVDLLGYSADVPVADADARNAVTTTWMMSFAQIRERSPMAADILSLMAFLDRHCVPESLIRRQKTPFSDLEFEKACGVLKAFSLIDERPLNIHGEMHRAFAIHRMVQLVTQQWLELHVFPPEEHEDWKKCEALMPHVQVVLDSKVESQLGSLSRAALLHNASSYFRVKGYHRRAEQVGVEAVAARKQSLGLDHPATLASHTNLSRILLEQGRLEEASQLHIAAMEAAEKTVQEDNQDMLRARAHLAALHGTQGRHEEAHQLQTRVVENSKKSIGNEHPDTLLVMRDLAVTYTNLQLYGEAETLHKQVLDIRKKVLGSAHPDTLISMIDLAETYKLQDPVNKASQAENLELEVVESRKKILGDEHPVTLQAMENLAMTYEWQYRYSEADILREAIKEISQRGCEQTDNHAMSALRTRSPQILTYKHTQQQSRPPRYRSCPMRSESCDGVLLCDTAAESGRNVDIQGMSSIVGLRRSPIVTTSPNDGGVGVGVVSPGIHKELGEEGAVPGSVLGSRLTLSPLSSSSSPSTSFFRAMTSPVDDEQSRNRIPAPRLRRRLFSWQAPSNEREGEAVASGGDGVWRRRWSMGKKI
ncbi:hypothetical protein EPUS_09197 [Endocarpon pusillum Z07020]|uniref:DUF676 domain-containing protein n=1 Tax=Endocarpon pusillum (strain Z07020 / HMAS-L-300199) TaxID=1263415 RepID=U1HU19_ENDPU|nr:uncharacterized protein EPUS_09197 [Endocarpon pusillum Z07020]ERF72769.1 hypothetical protein EPUS_09197 [Endocarpon pusillum Z07020]